MSARLSEPALRSLGVFGLTTDDVRRESAARAQRAANLAEVLHRDLPRGGVAHITGPSASGKSSILRALREHPRIIVVGGGGLLPSFGPSCDASCIDTILACEPRSDGALAEALGALSAAGLADAFIAARPLHALSEGERARLRIACTLLKAQRALAAGNAPTLLLDDFADALDDATAAAVVHTLRRWLVRHQDARLVLASVRASIVPIVAPDLHLSLGIDGQSVWSRSDPESSQDATCDIRIAVAAPSQYAAFAPAHYRAGTPATMARVLIARRDDQPVGVLVVSHPTLNGAWRGLAWPELSAADKRARAVAINRAVRCISRVIVHPLHRARGIGSALVRHYLGDPLTPRTEAVSAMGACSPLFTRAGMRQWILPPAPRDLRLLDALSAADLRPWMLADVDLVLDHLRRFRHLERALRVWAGAHGPTRCLAADEPRALIRAAARAVITARHAYTSG